jgi:hypothetical protein
MDRFDEINFGEARAEWETTNSPILIQRGFLDPNGVVPALMNQNLYLVLGNKGTGKSAIAEKLHSESTFKTKAMTTIIPLSDFPYTSFGNIMAGKEEPEARFPLTWSWLLLLLLLGSFLRTKLRRPNMTRSSSELLIPLWI